MFYTHCCAFPCSALFPTLHTFYTAARLHHRVTCCHADALLFYDLDKQSLFYKMLMDFCFDLASAVQCMAVCFVLSGSVATGWFARRPQQRRRDTRQPPMQHRLNDLHVCNTMTCTHQDLHPHLNFKLLNFSHFSPFDLSAVCILQPTAQTDRG